MEEKPSLPSTRLLEDSESTECRINDMFLHVEDQFRKVKQHLDPHQVRKVLILFTGGTIGMVNSDKGYIAKKGFLQKVIKTNKSFCDADYTFFNATDGFMITPVSIYKRRIWYKVVEFDEIIDSTNMTSEYWVKIGMAIKENYKAYDAFIILHGTDTMAYTASALSFMFENLAKTVIITGAQIPLSEMRNDGFENLLGSLTIAGHFTIPEVLIFFRDKLIRGNRAVKADNFGMDAFDSPKFPPLGTFGVTLDIDWKRIRKVPADAGEDLKLEIAWGKKIAVVKIYPLIDSLILESICKNAEAIVLEAYGLGNIPTNRPGLLKVLGDFAEKGKLIVVITQCAKGTTNPIYAVGKELLDKGVINGVDMTLEATVCKLAYILGKVPLRIL